MRTAVVILAALAFAAGLVIEPAALVQIARICLGGHCGVSTSWIEIGAFVLMAAGIVIIVRKRLRPPAPKRKGRPKKPGTGIAKNVSPKSRRRVEKP